MRKRCTGILTVIAVLVSAVAAHAQELKLEKSTTVFGLPIPDRVGSLSYRQTVDFESKSPGLGYGLRFSGKPGRIVDTYIYDLGLKAIPADSESDVIKQQLAQVRADVFEMGKRGTYANVTDRGDFGIPASGKPRFVCSSFGYLRGERVDIDVESFLCVTAWSNKFVKLRMTAPKGTISRADMTDFAQAWIKILR